MQQSKIEKKRNESACTHIQVVHPFTKGNMKNDTTRIRRSGSFCYFAPFLLENAFIFERNTKSAPVAGLVQPSHFVRSSFCWTWWTFSISPVQLLYCNFLLATYIIETGQIRGSLLLSLTLLISGWDFHFNWVRLNHEGKKLKIFTRQFDYRSRYRISW